MTEQEENLYHIEKPKSLPQEKMTEEIKELRQENERIKNEINDIMFINNFDTKEKDELWSKILNLIDNEIEQEEYCNQ